TFNSMAGARPTNNAMPRAGMTGMQSAAMRQNNSGSRPDLGLRGGGMSGGGAQNFPQMRQPSAPIATRPPFNTSSGQGPGANLAATNRRDAGGFARPGGAAQAGIARPAGLAPTITPASLTRPSSEMAGTRPGSRPMYPGGRPSIAGSNGAGSLAGLNRPGGSNIPNGRPDLGGGGSSTRADGAYKRNIA